MKDLLLNVGSGGGAATAPSGGAAAAGGDAAAPAEEKKEEKEEGTLDLSTGTARRLADTFNREGGIRRGYGLRSVRLSGCFTIPLFHQPQHGRRYMLLFTAKHKRTRDHNEISSITIILSSYELVHAMQSALTSHKYRCFETCSSSQQVPVIRTQIAHLRLLVLCQADVCC